MQRARNAVDDGDGRAKLVRGDCHELVLQLVHAAQLLERPLELVVLLGLRDEDRGHEPECRERIEVAFVERELAAAAIGDEEAEAAAAAVGRARA